MLSGALKCGFIWLAFAAVPGCNLSDPLIKDDTGASADSNPSSGPSSSTEVDDTSPRVDSTRHDPDSASGGADVPERPVDDSDVSTGFDVSRDSSAPSDGSEAPRDGTLDGDTVSGGDSRDADSPEIGENDDAEIRDDSGDGEQKADGSDGGESDTCSPQPEICNGKDDDCDGIVDEDADTVVLSEDFEGSDPLGWQKVPSGANRLKVDDDATGGSPPQGSEYGKAWYRTGTCESFAGIGASKSISGEVDEITLQLNVDVDDWGRAALFVRDSAGNVTTLWTANAKGNGFTTNGWKKLTFDHSTSSSTTKPSGAVVEINPIPSGLGNETVWFLFGNNDDSSHCTYLDHTWTTRVDALEVVDRCN